MGVRHPRRRRNVWAAHDRRRRFGLHDVIFSIPNSALGGFLLRLDFSKSNAPFDFGNFRFLPGQFVVSGLAGQVSAAM